MQSDSFNDIRNGSVLFSIEQYASVISMSLTILIQDKGKLIFLICVEIGNHVSAQSQYCEVMAVNQNDFKLAESFYSRGKEKT